MPGTSDGDGWRGKAAWWRDRGAGPGYGRFGAREELSVHCRIPTCSQAALPRLSFKPDSSFFEKIALGAVGSRAVLHVLNGLGHQIAELENGSTDVKIWKDVKRKRVRIPDLVCINCGMRVESRAKRTADLSMSHSTSEAERAWDFGMVDDDAIAFPICQPVDEKTWTAGRLEDGISYWHSRDRILWTGRGHINFFLVGNFRAVEHARTRTKGVTEGSETSISWDAVFSSRAGTVERIEGHKVSIRRASDDHLYTWWQKELPVVVAVGEEVEEFQILSSAVAPMARSELTCTGGLTTERLRELSVSPERTQRFTGIKLARLRDDRALESAATMMMGDNREDVYTRLEAAAYLAAVCEHNARNLFTPFLEGADEQIRLESVVALAEAGTIEAVDLLSEILDDVASEYFLRSAAAWALGCIGSEVSVRRLIECFRDIEQSIREEALEAVANLNSHALGPLLLGLRTADKDIAAGCAEAIRRLDEVPASAIAEIKEMIERHPSDLWPVWLMGQLGPNSKTVLEATAQLEETSPAAHYAVTVLWAFVNSWISTHWEPHPEPGLR